MKIFNHKYFFLSLCTLVAIMMITGCSRDIDELEPADFPTDGDVFIDGFTGGLNYAAFGGSDVTAFDTDTDTKYKGTTSMVFRVPDVGDPAGAYAGGTFYLDGGRDLSGYNVLTFWAKATKSATIDVVGFGNDLGENKFVTSINDVKVNTNWKQFFIPIPDASKLTVEKGMFFYSEGPEDGNGYTFWIDEVRFEKLGTLGQPRAAIQGGEDQAITSETGAVITLSGSVTTNLEDGTNQTVNAAPAFFNFESTDDAVASVNDLGQVMVMSEGEATITAKLGDDPAEGSLIITSTGAPVLPATKAPTPMIPAQNVISLYSDAYTDVPVDTWNPFWEFSTAMEQEVQVDGDFMRRYTTLNFVGIEFVTQQINATEMTHFHLDMWTPESTDAGQEFKILLVDFGPDGAFGGDDDASHELTFTAPTLTTESWVSLDIPLSDFAGLTQRANMAQLVLSGTVPTVFIDNVFFYDDGGMTGVTAPETGADNPTQDAANVISIFSDSYTNVEGTNLNPDWGQATSTSEIDIAGNNTLLMAGLNYQGIEFGQAIDVSGMTHLHLDYWTTNSSQLNVFLISDGPVETPVALGVPTMGWGGIDIPLNQFDPVDLAAIIQMKFDGNGTIYMDNIYFFNDGGTGGSDMPTTAAPTPTHDAADVVSLFSDSYTSVDGLNLNPDWGQSTQVSEEMIDGNNTLKYATFNYQGTEFTQVDLSGMEFLHVDMWTADATDVKITPISTSGEFLTGLTPINSGQWTSYDIPLSAFSDNGVNLSEIFQIKLDGQAGNTPSNLWLDNIYFYKNGGTSGGDTPTVAAPTPTHDAANVVSLFSDSYTSVDGLNLNPDWGQSTQVSEEMIEGNNTLKYATFNYQGTEFTQQDLSGMEFLHIDMWTADATDVKITPISTSGEFLKGLTPINSGQWTSYDIPLSAFSDNGVNLSEIFQIKLDGQAGNTPSNLWLDNIYFYNNGGTMGEDNPTVAAPTPTVDADKVVSVFSDSYTNIEGVNFNPNWGQSTVVSEEMVAGNNTLKYASFNYQGTEFPAQDLSGMKFLHIDMWTADATNVQVTPISSTGEFLTALDPINSGQWTSYDIPLSTFSDMGVTLGDIFQLKFDGQAGTTPSNIWLDNIFFYTDEDMGSGDDMPTTTAPDPSVDASRVISVFSDSYMDIDGTDYNPNWGQSTVVTTMDIMGNNVLSYADFNYQGTQLGFQQDLSNMEFLHIDMWTADATDVKVTPISASSGEYLTPLAPIMSGQWVSYDIPLATFIDNGMTMADIIQIKMDGQGGGINSNIWLDNIFFYRTTDLPMMPTEAAPEPITDANRVVSIYSDSYNSVSGLDLNPNWGQSTQVSEQMIEGNNTLIYADFNYQGTQFDQVDLSSMAFLHVDMWTADATDVKVTPISANSGEALVGLTPITPGVWNSYDIPVSMFTDGGMSFADIFQMKFDGQGGESPSNLYLDNIYFYQDGANGPATAAPTPTEDAANVISVFSDSYTNVDGTDFNPNWGQATQVSFEEIDGNNTMLYTGLNYQGIQLGTPVDASSMTTLNVDVWTNTSTELRVFLISPGGVETPVIISVPTSGWSEVSIPLSDFAPVDMTDIIQFKFDGNGDIYIDNIYFSN